MLQQNVTVQSDNDAVQKAFIERESNWVIIKHDNQELSLSIENWEKLKELVDELIYVEESKNRIDREHLSSIIVEFKRAEHYYWSDLVENRFSQAKDKAKEIRKRMAEINYKIKKLTK